MIRIINADLERYVTDKRLAGKVKILLASHGFHLVLFIRIGQFISSIKIIGGIFRILAEYIIRIIFASDISLRAKFGPGLVILHGHDIVIGSNSVIGKNCKIMNGVTLGNKDTESGINDQPIIGDSVVIGTGAKILGKITVGNRVKIGANSVVLTDVPDGAIAVGVPAKIKKIHKACL